MLSLESYCLTIKSILKKMTFSNFLFCWTCSLLLSCVCPANTVLGAESIVTPSVSVETRYNDNVYFSESDEENDYYVVVSPAIKMQHGNERGIIIIKGKVYSYTYADRTELDSIDNELSANGNYAVNRTMTVNASGNYKKDHQSDRDLTSSGLVSTNSKREQHQETLGFDWALSEKTRIGATVTLGKTRYEDEDYSDNTTKSYSLELASNLSKHLPETTGIISLNRSCYDYDLSQTNYTSASFGFVKNLNEKYSILASAGPSLIETTYKASPFLKEEEWGATAHCSLDGKFKKSSMNLAFTYKLEPDSLNNKSVKRTALNAGYVKKISSDLSLGFKAGYFHNESSAQENILANSLDEDTFNISPRLLYQISDDLGLELNYRFARIEDNKTDSSRTQNSLFMLFTWSHDIDESDLADLL